MDCDFLNMLSDVLSEYNITLSDEEKRLLFKISDVRFISKGEIIKRLGEKLTHIGLVLNGLTRNYYLDADGNDVTKGFGIKGGLCMDEGLFGYENSLCICEAIEDTTLMLINKAEFQKLCMQNDNLKNIYIMYLEMLLRYKIYRENSFLTLNATERYLDFCRNFPSLSEKIKQSHLATFLGVAPESLSRIKKTISQNV